MMPRCPECGNWLLFSFRDELTGEHVYTCSSVGVPVLNKKGRVAGFTLDHSDRFFKTGPLRRVLPVHVKPIWFATNKENS